MNSNELYRGIIYKYTSPSGKVYIGQTMNERKRRSDFLCITTQYSGPKIENARKKYGPENFQYEVLFTIESLDKKEVRDILNSKEKEYIILFDSINHGYNIDEGGAVKDIYSNRVESEETKQLRSEQMKLRWKNGFKGCSGNKEAIQNMKDKLSIPILQYDIRGNFVAEWKSAVEAGKALNVNKSLITKVCKRQSWVCRGYIFVYKSEYSNVPSTIDITYIPEVYRLNKNGYKRGGNYKIIYQLDVYGTLIKKFGSAKEAAKEFNCSEVTIRKHIRSKDIFKGFKFTYNYEQLK